MKNSTGSACFVLAGIMFMTNALAEDFNFDVGLIYESTRFDGSKTITTPGGITFNSGEIDTDDVSVFGSWYFAGLSDDKGPRSRAVLVDRASSLSLAYTRSDQTFTQFLTSTDPLFPFSPIDLRSDTDGDTFALDVRYVDRDSGWFGNAGLLSTDVTLDGFVFDSVDAKGWRLGVGKYLFKSTTLSLDIGRIESDDFGDATVYDLAFEHLGDLGSQWQYAVDINFNRADFSGGFESDSWGGALSLYPNRDFEFGVGFEDVAGNGIGQRVSGLEGFASWFITPNFSLAARYRVDDPVFFGNFSTGAGTTVSDADQDTFGISATVRF